MTIPQIVFAEDDLDVSALHFMGCPAEVRQECRWHQPDSAPGRLPRLPNRRSSIVREKEEGQLSHRSGTSKAIPSPPSRKENILGGDLSRMVFVAMEHQRSVQAVHDENPKGGISPPRQPKRRPSSAQPTKVSSRVRRAHAA